MAIPDVLFFDEENYTDCLDLNSGKWTKEKKGKREIAYDKVCDIAEGKRGRLKKGQIKLAINFIMNDLGLGSGDTFRYTVELTRAVLISINRGASREIAKELLRWFEDED